MDRDFYYAEMACFKRMKFWKRANNCKTGVIRSILKCLLPCIRQRARSPSPEGSRTSEKETSRGRKRTRDLRLKDLKIIRRLGAGSFGQVFLAKKKSTRGHSSSKEVFALKIVPKQLVYEVEKEVLVRAVGHPFLVQLHAYFQARASVCYVMEYCEGGTLRSLMSRLQLFHEDLVRFYAAEIILAVKFLHECGIVHRDIKPENILLDRGGHCKLADFGLSEVGMFQGKLTEGVCGTVWYRAPEIQRGRLYGPEVDWWSVGCIMFDMMVGDCPAEEDLLYPEEYPLCLKKDAISILNMLLVLDPRRRLGAHGDTRSIQGDTRSIQRHPFFKAVNWKAVFEKRVTPPVNPLTLEFLAVDAEAPGDACDLARTPSIENTHCEAIVEKPPLQPLTLDFRTVEPEAPGEADDLGRNLSIKNTHCEAIVEQPPLQPLTVDPEARGEADDLGRNLSIKNTHCETTLEQPPFQPLIVDPEARGEADKSRSDISFQTANEGAVLEGSADEPQTVKCPTTDPRASGKMKKLVTAAAAAAVVVFSFVLLVNVLYNF